MPRYTTGEMAKLCGVSVRTVQYYDARDILKPSELSEGGRRLYSRDDLKKMRIICFLRDAGISINGIGELFREENPEKVISVLLQEQEKELLKELEEGKKKLEIIEEIRNEVKGIENFTVESIGDIANMMKSKEKLKRMRRMMILAGTPSSVLQWTAIILGITRGMWWMLAVWACVAVPAGIWMSRYYFRHAAYICPECHETFRAGIKEMFWAYHTPRMRRLKCPGCGRKGMCVEIYWEAADEKTKEN